VGPTIELASVGRHPVKVTLTVEPVSVVVTPDVKIRFDVTVDLNTIGFRNLPKRLRPEYPEDWGGLEET
jgi:hypothetical protein